MDTRGNKINGSEMNAQVIIPEVGSEIDLKGLELLKLEFEQPAARVICTDGVIWLTQQCDPQDHLLKSGQSFTIDQQGTVLMQGLPCGKVLVLDHDKMPSYPKKSCSSQLNNLIEIEQ